AARRRRRERRRGRRSARRARREDRAARGHPARARGRARAGPRRRRAEGRSRGLTARPNAAPAAMPAAAAFESESREPAHVHRRLELVDLPRHLQIEPDRRAARRPGMVVRERRAVPLRRAEPALELQAERVAAAEKRRQNAAQLRLEADAARLDALGIQHLADQRLARQAERRAVLLAPGPFRQQHGKRLPAYARALVNLALEAVDECERRTIDELRV